jgi:peptidoglycan/xylan/chitin deacetylase (PgdA/CDA1 family)
MTESAMRFISSLGLRWLRRVATDRKSLYGGETGLRILVFHDLDRNTFGKFYRLVDWCRARFTMGVPDDVDALLDGCFQPAARDKVHITFDDGIESNFQAAEWMAQAGLRGTFFLVPSFLGRTGAEFQHYHERQGITPHRFGSVLRGLSRTQVREMLSMGHRIAAHNYAHRDLGKLHGEADLDYEIRRALDEVSDLKGTACEDFAVAFGQIHNLSPAAMSYLRSNCKRVYMCFRGLNVPERTPRFLLRHSVNFDHPDNFTRLCIEGGADRRMAARSGQLARDVGVLPPTVVLS